MRKSISSLMVLALVLVSTAVLAQEKKMETVTVTGIMTDSVCGAAGEAAGHDPAKCVKENGAKWAIYDEANKTVYVLSNQDMGPKMMAGKAAGKKIKVKGTMDPKTKTMMVTEYNWI
jgi:hypothetical protein